MTDRILIQIWCGSSCFLTELCDCVQIQLPVITDLRNPCMKPEHWKSLESVVGTSLNVEELTVAVLEDINIFSYGTEIQQVTHKCSYVLRFCCCPCHALVTAEWVNPTYKLLVQKVWLNIKPNKTTVSW